MDLRTLYRDIVETSPDGIWVIDVEGRTLHANARVAELLGREPEEVQQLTVFDALDADGRAQFAQHLVELRDGGLHAHDVECLWVRGDGGHIWVLLRESPLYDEQGNLQGFLHRVTDYSERRALFEKLNHGRYLLAEAQRIARIGSYEWDLQADRIVASDELHALYGIPREEFGGTYDAFIELVHEDDRDVVHGAVQDALDGADAFDFVVRVPRDGDVRWMRGRGELFRDAEGKPVQARGTHQDVTDAKQSEETLQDLVAQNALMQAVATAANEAETLIEVLAQGQNLLMRHDDWVRARGYLRRPGSSRLEPLHLDREEREVDRGIPEQTAYEHALAEQVLDAGGQVWDEQTHPGRPTIAFPVRVGDEVAAVIVMTASTPFERHEMIRGMIDQVAVQLGRVAERDRAARELAAARDAAMEGSRQKSEFLATMSHEIRTPLNGVIGLNDLLLRTALDPHQHRLASGAQIASRALLSVVNDILDFSKIEAGRLELEAVDFDVRTVFDQVASVLGESARSKELELLVSCHPDVPERVNGDPTRLVQVLTNLGSNAVKFTDSGEVSIRATADPAPRGGTVLRVEVSDTGIGIAADKQEHIFEAFSQADASTTRQYGGTGLGLAIASEIVAALGGEIGVRSTPGDGATFWFSARLDAAGPETAEPAGADGTDLLAGRRVLVVDDNASNRLILTEHATRWEMRSDAVPGALEALDAMAAAVAAGDAYDVVLLDMAMPGYDGLHLARQVREAPALSRIPLVMLTSLTDLDAEELAGAGIVECLTKPVLAGEVHDVLVRVLRGEPQGPAATLSRPARSSWPPVPPRLEDRPHLLVVEDNPVNQLVALGILETLGYSADTADDGMEALERLRTTSYAAVLMDVQMPRLDGYAATRALREHEDGSRRTPVIAMTAAAVEGERQKCLDAGMDDFLTKPVNPDALGSMLRRWVDRDGSEPARRSPDEQPVAGAGVLDRDRLDMLRDLDPGNTTYLDKAIGNFVARVPESVHALRTAIAAKDHDALTQSSHRLKGSALNLGLPVVGHLAHELEMLGDTGTTAGAPALLELLEEALGHGVGEVRWYQRGYQQVGDLGEDTEQRAT